MLTAEEDKPELLLLRESVRRGRKGFDWDGDERKFELSWVGIAKERRQTN